VARIAIAGFMHETNCFVPGRTGYGDFANPADRAGIRRGGEILEQFAERGAATAGFLNAIGTAHKIVPLLWTSTTPGGYVTAEAYERIAGEIIERLSEALPVDAVYLDLHGAMVTDDFEDGEGELLRRVRASVGGDVPIAASLDYHANVTARMVGCADALLPYRTYPHVDQFEAGGRAAAAVERLLTNGRPAGRALKHLPFLLPLHQQCTLVEPSKGIVEATTARQDGELLSLAYLAGFPPGDLRECGPSVSAHGETQEAAEAAVDEVAALITAREADFAMPLLDPDAAVLETMRLAAGVAKPVVVADTQDNPGCGGTADTVGMLAALARNGAHGALFGVVRDADAAARAHAAGTGAEIEIDLGGKARIPGVEPFHGRFTVEGLSDGVFSATGPVAQGRHYRIGPSALLAMGGVRVAVSSERVQAHDRSVFEHLGVVLEDQDIIIVKSTAHYRAHFDPIAETTFCAIAPGAHGANPADFPYERLRDGVRYGPLGAAHGVAP